jgi:hypothetical protein
VEETRERSLSARPLASNTLTVSEVRKLTGSVAAR